MKSKLLCIDEYRNNPEFYFCKGLRCANKRNMGGAYKNVAKASALEPTNSEYKFNMACFLSELQRPNEANRIFHDILLNYDPTMYDCYFGLGCNYLEIGDIEKAAENFEKYLYFDEEGEFSPEVQDMIFYLKLYNDIFHDNKFIELSMANLRKAKKNLRSGKQDIAVRELYKALRYNPLNIEARNLITLALMERQQYTKAEYINLTVRSFYMEDVWAKCLWMYILSRAGKHSRVDRFLKICTLSEIDDRDDLLCIATTLLVYNKIEELVAFLEMHIVEYSDPLIYSVLLLGYILSENFQKAGEVSSMLKSAASCNSCMIDWIDHVNKDQIDTAEEYEKIFAVNMEPFNYAYYPRIYYQLLQTKRIKKPKVNCRLLPIVECAVQHKEIVYAADYEKEIMELINNGPDISDGERIEECSAAIEYIYCQKYDINMEKDELTRKYDISIEAINRILKKAKASK